VRKLFSVFITLFFLFVAIPSASAQTLPLGKHIEVDLTRQELFAFDGTTLVYDFPISSGTLAHPTVTGTFYPYAKLLSTTMIGGTPGTEDYYDLPGVPYTQYFYQGYGIHGTYWHHNFGHPMSHGCINVSTPNAQTLYYWTDYSTPIHIYGVTPPS